MEEVEIIHYMELEKVTIHMEKNETGFPKVTHRLTKDLNAKTKLQIF